MCSILNCGFCYANLRGRAAYRGHRYCPPAATSKKESVMALLRRHGLTNGQSKLRSSTCRNSDLLDFPDLSDFLYLEEWLPDGGPRVPGTVLLFTDGGVLKAMLNDKDGDCVAFLTIAPGTSPLAALNDAVSSPLTDWRTARKSPKSK